MISGHCVSDENEDGYGDVMRLSRDKHRRRCEKSHNRRETKSPKSEVSGYGYKVINNKLEEL